MVSVPTKIDFKSLTSKISSNTDIDDLIGYVLNCQEYFSKWLISPYEATEWTESSIKRFIIKSEHIDRCYYIEYFVSEWNIDMELYCHMLYDNTPYYIHMSGSCELLCGFDCHHCSIGHIYLSKSPIYFFQHAVCDNSDLSSNVRDGIFASLSDDGFKIPLLDSQHHIHPKRRRSSPSLKLLCHESIYSSKEVSSIYQNQLPKILVNSLNEFIDFKKWEQRTRLDL